MFNLKKKHQELTALRDELMDIKYELVEAQRYYLNHPEDHIPAFSDKSAAPQRFEQTQALINKVDERRRNVVSQLHKRKYNQFYRK